MSLPHPRFLAFLAVATVMTVVAALRMPIEEAAILGFDLAAVAFIGLALPLWAADSPADARARAARDDGGRVRLLLTAVAVLAAILLALGRMVEGRNHLTTADFAIVAGTLVLAWIFSNLLYAFHYAHMFYDTGSSGDAGGILFPEGGAPVFADFVYFAFVIGMTCQTADLHISSRRIRRAVTLHGLFAFFFNLGVLAMTINVLSGVL
ncbi:MAG: DUF1345 domain-containing protein [Gemmobacter sp.]|uniref:DUF1345 domain-containing protein n=1 Tax=Gemmobacter sp. TaxID=1898957 RepID=UPI00391A4805